MIIQFFTSLFHRLSAVLAESSAVTRWRFILSLNTKTVLIAVLLMLIAGLAQAQDRPFITTWETTSSNQSIKIPWNSNTYNLDYTVDWGDGSVDTHVANDANHTYAEPGIYEVQISGFFDAILMPNGSSSNLLSIEQWGDIPWRTMSYAFANTTNLQINATDAPNLSAVTDMSGMFQGASSLDADLGAWDISHVTNMSQMLYGTNLSVDNYEQTLAGWSTLDTDETSIPTGVTFGAQGLRYCDNSSRTLLADTYGWTLNGDAPVEQGIILHNASLEYIISQEPITSLAPPTAETCDGEAITATTDATFPISEAQTITWTYTSTSGASRTQEQEIWVGRPFVTTWETANFIDAQNFIRIPINSGLIYNYSYKVDWGDGSTDNTIYTKANQAIHEYASEGTYTIAVYGDFPAISSSSAFDRSKFMTIEQWGDIEWKSMNSAFANLSNMVCNATDVPNLTQVTDMYGMFNNATGFTGDLSAWDVSHVTEMRHMFYYAKSFNSDLSAWDVSHVTNMSYMFYRASSFDQSLANWDISSVTQMSSMLSYSGFSTPHYDQTLAGWATLDTEGGETKIPTNQYPSPYGLIYCDATSRSTLNNNYSWNISGDQEADGGIVPDAKFLSTVIGKSSLESLVAPTATACDGEIITATTDAVLPITSPQTITWTYTATGGNTTTQEQYVFAGRPFVTTWETIDNLEGQNNVVYIPGYDEGFNFVVDWGDGTVDETIYSEDVDAVHSYATAGTYTVSVYGQFPYFYAYDSYSPDKLVSIDQWGDIQWDDLTYMFEGATKMVYNATDTPDLSYVTDLSGMFYGLTSFNADLSNWDVSQIEYMDDMFYGASSFNQNLGNWDISSIEDMEEMLSGTGLSAQNYKQTLAGWSTLDTDNGETSVPTDIYLGAEGLRYCDDTDRNILIDTYSWTIDGDGEAENGIVPNTNNLASVISKESIETIDAPTATTCDGEAITATTETIFPITEPQTIVWNYTATDGSTATQEQYVFVGRPFVTTWQTIDDFGFSNFVFIPINTNTDSPFNFIVDWGDGTVDNTLYTKNSFPIHSYATAGIYTVSIYGQFPGLSASNGPGGEFLMSIEQWGDIEWETMESAFRYTENMVYNATDAPNLSNVTDMSDMFYYASSFNGDLSNWDVSQVENMESMFYRASSFDQSLGHWDISSVLNMEEMLDYSGLSVQNYDLTLAGWSTLDTEAGETLIPSNISLGVEGLYYCDGNPRATLGIGYVWSFDGDEQNCPPTVAEELDDLVGACSVDMPTVLPTAYDAENDETITGVSDTTFPVYASTEITWTFTDSEGNSSTQTQQVTITDSESPVADVMTLAVVNIECGEVETLTAPTATDNCTGVITATTETTFPITSTTTVTWVYSDANGNTSTQTQEVVFADVTAPVADAATLTAVNAQCAVAETDLTVPTATDNCSGAINATTDATFPITETTTITWNLTVPTATDNCSGAINATTDATFPITETTTITWTFTDGSGNTATQTQEVVISDTTAPVADVTTLTALSRSRRQLPSLGHLLMEVETQLRRRKTSTSSTLQPL
ncbi:BspA family leucine-rich repeat surface protein [Reichenbachiella sp. MSK19-1]|uniref:BspA family leucine-rich repeat surface protein n=1 Tax=Reichenbachiella sp. MSK19-1 TaxID=1897631 RepID=UPI000E6B792A|nr:BspA family leucine-rich repeat surface protein [Reichenbachiella sp. MSK19-1]RJE72804.1 hypothetical protein BGP76_02305 [Reichenbachiella sp. MSK19-1]